MRELPRLGHECLPVTRENYTDMIGLFADVLVNANGNSAKYLARRDPTGEIERSVTSVLRTCLDFNFQRYVLLSTADVYHCQRDPAGNSEATPIEPARLSTYGLCKYMAECVVRNQCEHWLILRCGGLIGPGLRKNPLFDLLNGCELRVHPDSEFGFLHTDGLARIVDQLLRQDAGNRVVNTCGDGLVSVRELAELTGHPDARFHGDTHPIRYDINIDRLRHVCAVPASREAVLKFLTSYVRRETPSLLTPEQSARDTPVSSTCQSA